MRSLRLSVLAAASLLACNQGPDVRAVPFGSQPVQPLLVISEILADPQTVPDSVGEWIELQNRGDSEVSLEGWILRSRNDHPHRIAKPLSITAGGRAVLGQSADVERNGGVSVDYAWSGALALANGADWLVLAMPDGRAVDSVAWRRPVRGIAMGRVEGAPLLPDVEGEGWAAQTPVFGSGDRGTPGLANVAAGSPLPFRADDRPSVAPVVPPVVSAAGPHDSSGVTIRVLDVGQGDAILITAGNSVVIVDGGPDQARMGQLLDSLGLRDTTIDLVIATHQHADHYTGLHALFETGRRLRVRRFAENLDVSPNQGLARLRDSVIARMRRGETELRDTDDPCGDGRAVCTFQLDGGVRLHLLRPWEGAESANDRSAIVKLVGPDSSRFSMWLAGDAEHPASEWMYREAGYDRAPGMDVHVVKASHHGSCDAISRALLSRLTPEWMVMSLAAVNEYGHVHTQTMRLLRQRGVNWYRTDVNGTIAIQVLADGSYTITPSRGTQNATGTSDRHSGQDPCRRL